MLLLVNNRALVKDREKTWLTASVAAAGTTLTVKAVDNIAWADNDWVIVGEIGAPNAEVLQINGAVSDGTSLTVDNAGSGGARYAHAANEPVYRIDYNQVRFARGTTTVGADATTLATNQLQPDDYETRYEDTANTTGYGFARFFNSQTSALSPYSDAIPYAGQSAKSLAKMVSKVRALVDEQEDAFVTDAEIADALNDKQRDVVSERLWTFDEGERSASSAADTFEYAVPSAFKTLHTVRFRTEPLRRIGESRWESLHWDTDSTSSSPTHCAVWADKVRVYPRPSAAAAADQLNGAVSDTATTLTLDDTGDFKRGDYYRLVIDSEVIYATAATSTTFTGCLRGREGTTAASHADDATVTERDIVYAGQLAAVDLSAQDDETVVPEPLVLCYGVAADLCLGKLGKPTLGDRYEAKYLAGMAGLRDRYTLKVTSQFGRVKDPREVPTDDGTLRNPNDYPSSVG